MFQRKNYAGVTKKKKSHRRMPEWDSTINDLTVHKATTEEVQHRKLVHMSKNVDKARRELKERRQQKRQDDISPGEIELEMKKLAILREVLYDHDDLNEVLKRVDNTMSSVKNVFHEPPARKSGNLNVTFAPGSKSNKSAGLNITLEPPTQMSILSECIVDKKALNDESSSSEEDDDESEFESQVDYNRFLNLLKNSLSQSIAAASNAKDVTKDTSTATANLVTTPRQKSNLPFALNGTEVVRKTMRRVDPQELPEKDTNVADNETIKTIDQTITTLAETRQAAKPKSKPPPATILVAPANNSTVIENRTYDNLQDAVEVVKMKINELDQKSGKTPSNVSFGSGLSGFTATLIDAVTRLSTIMNEHEEKILSQQKLNEDMMTKNDHLKALVDALTVEVMKTQAQMYEMHKSDSNKQEEKTKKLEQEIEDLKANVQKIQEACSDRRTSVVVEEVHCENPPAVIVDESLPEIEKVIVTNNASTNEDANDEDEEEALKMDMVALLNALKSDTKSMNVVKKEEDMELPQPPSMNTKDAISSAQTMAAVESQLKHLQLQHAEAQQRMRELTRYATDMAEKITNENDSESDHRANHVSYTATPTDSLATNHTQSPALSEHMLQNSHSSFNFLVPTISDRSETTISPQSSPNASIVFPAVQASAHPPPQYINIVSARTTSSSTSTDRTEPTPRLLQSNIKLPTVDSDVDANLETIMSQITDKFRMPQTLSPFRPYPNTQEKNTVPESSPQYQQVISKIANSQASLEERIQQLNAQHTEAQSRLQLLITGQTSDHTEKVTNHIQVSIPTDDMLQTPQNNGIHHQFTAPMAWSQVLQSQD